jgi:hypothetical protein
MVVAALRQRRIRQPVSKTKTARQNRAVFLVGYCTGTCTHKSNQPKTLGHVRFGGASYGEVGDDRNELRRSPKGVPGGRSTVACETIGGIQIVRDNTPGSFSVRVTLYGQADKKTADRAINCVAREKRRHFHLLD